MPDLSQLRITDEDLESAKPAVRALLVSRLERMWRPIEQHLDQSDAVEGAIPPDPRLLEIGLRIVRDEAVLYQMTKPRLAVEQEEAPELGAGVDRRALVLAQLEEREARLRQ